MIKSTKTRYQAHQPVQVELSTRTVGAWGLTLDKILTDAKTFVSHGDGTGEFIILKFDKCTNWSLIAEARRKVLGAKLYNGQNGPNINTRTLAQLGGYVI